MSTSAVSKANSFANSKSAPVSSLSSPDTRNRIRIAVPVDVCGTDLNGQDFLEHTQTESVSASGATLLLNRFLGPDQNLVMRRRGSRKETVGTVVGQIGIRPHGFVYGIAVKSADSNFWGVHFPPGSEATHPTSVRCTCCLRVENVELDEIEAGVLQANNLLSRACDECCAITFWQHCEASESTPVSSGAKPNRRRNLRTAMKASACLCQPTGLRDVAALLDISRGGICFRTTQTYTVHSWVELAVPYTEGGANIFVPGRIAWERPLSNGSREYGVQYVRN